MIGRGPNDEKSGVEKRAERQVSKFRRYADTKGWKEREGRYKQQMKIREDYMDEEDYDLQELKDATVKSAIEKAQTKAKAARRNSDSDAEYAYGSQANRLKQALDRKKRRQKAEKYEPSAAKTRKIVARNKEIEKHNAQQSRPGESDDVESAAARERWRNDPLRRRRMKGK
jgi:hypothetical protein